MKEYMKNYLKYFKEEGKKCLDELKNIKTAYKQVPNILTISRLLATIPINIFYFTGNIPAALITCAAAALTDMVDGKYARKFNCASKFGADLDAICDKLFIILMSIPIVIQNPFMLVNLGLEAGITITNLNTEKNGKHVKSEMIGKIKTWVLSLTVLTSYLLPLLNITPNLFESLLITIPATLFQTASLVKYSEINKEAKQLQTEEIEEKINLVVEEKNNNEKELEKELTRPATIEELKLERKKLLQQTEEKGYQKTKTDLK